MVDDGVYVFVCVLDQEKDEESAELFSQEGGREEEVKKKRSETKTNTRHQIHQGLWRRSAARSRSGWDKPPEVQDRGSGRESW